MNNLAKIFLALLICPVPLVQGSAAIAGGDAKATTNFCCTGYCGDNAKITCNYTNAVGDERIFTAKELATIPFTDYGLVAKTERKTLRAPQSEKMVGGRGTTSLGELAGKPLEFIAMLEQDGAAIQYVLFRKVGSDPVWREFGKIGSPELIDELYFELTPDGFAIWVDRSTHELRAVNLSANPKPQPKIQAKI